MVKDGAIGGCVPSFSYFDAVEGGVLGVGVEGLKFPWSGGLSGDGKLHAGTYLGD